MMTANIVKALCAKSVQIWSFCPLFLKIGLAKRLIRVKLHHREILNVGFMDTEMDITAK